VSDRADCRYVNELVKLNETFCKALLPPSAQSPSLQLLDITDTLTHTLARTLSPSLSQNSSTPTSPDTANLPIAARYASSSNSSGFPMSSRSPSGDSNTSRLMAGGGGGEDQPATQTAARRNAYNILTNGRPTQTPVHKSSVNTLSKGRSHHSLPPLPRNAGEQATTAQSSFSASYARMSLQPRLASGKANISGADRRERGSSSSSSLAPTKEVAIPEDLEKVLAVLGGNILEGHLKLVAALKKRYENQYPLVRSLADVFTAHVSDNTDWLPVEYRTTILVLISVIDSPWIRDLRASP
jgi:hypothetical protein